MKAEINNENKAKFFALYWGQEVFNCDIPYKRNAIILGFQIDKYLVNGSHLFLKPLSSISDEDALELANGGLGDNHNEKDLMNHARKFIIPTIDFIGLQSYQADFLRSRGYALPWMGLSVNEMIEVGWIKLI